MYRRLNCPITRGIEAHQSSLAIVDDKAPESVGSAVCVLKRYRGLGALESADEPYTEVLISNSTKALESYVLTERTSCQNPRCLVEERQGLFHES